MVRANKCLPSFYFAITKEEISIHDLMKRIRKVTYNGASRPLSTVALYTFLRKLENEGILESAGTVKHAKKNEMLRLYKINKVKYLQKLFNREENILLFKIIEAETELISFPLFSDLKKIAYSIPDITRP